MTSPAKQRSDPVFNRARLWFWPGMLLAALIALLLLFQTRYPAGERSSPTVDRGPQPEVVMFATRHCGYCAQARAFFARYGIRFTEYDVEKDSGAAASLQLLGGRGVPVFVVGDEVIHGMDERRLRRLLGDWVR